MLPANFKSLEQRSQNLEQRRQNLEQRKKKLEQSKKSLNIISSGNYLESMRHSKNHTSRVLQKPKNNLGNSSMVFPLEDYVNNLRFKLDLYYTFYKRVIALMKLISPLYKYKKIKSIEESCNYLKIVNNNFYSLLKFEDYKKFINRNDIIKIYKIAVDTEDNELKNKINELKIKINDLNINKYLELSKLNITYLEKIENTLYKGRSFVVNSTGSLISGIFTTLFAIGKFNKSLINFKSLSNIKINEYDTKITLHYQNINYNFTKANVERNSSFPKQYWLLNTKEKAYDLGLLYFFKKFFPNNDELIELEDKLKFKNDQELYDILSEIYPISYNNDEYIKINDLFNIYFKINTDHLNLDPYAIIILLKICNYINNKIEKKKCNNKKSNTTYYCFTIASNFIDNITQKGILADPLLTNKKKLLNKDHINKKILLLLEITKHNSTIDITKNLFKIITGDPNIEFTEDTDKKLLIFKSKVTNQNNYNNYNNLKILIKIIRNKIIDYFIKKKKRIELLNFLIYSNFYIEDNFFFSEYINECIRQMSKEYKMTNIY